MGAVVGTGEVVVAAGVVVAGGVVVAAGVVVGVALDRVPGPPPTNLSITAATEGCSDA
jgi:hypothetical protein